MGDMVNRTFAEVRLDVSMPLRLANIAIDGFIADVQVAESLTATAANCEFRVSPIESGLRVRADEQLLHSAVSNLLHNAFKFTRERGLVSLDSFARGDRVLIEVGDQCGGLPDGQAQAIFAPFDQHAANRSSMGSGLSISRRAVEAIGGELRVRDLPGHGCVFTIDLPRHPT
jgi:signal transduction histidine kinase